MSFQQGSTAGDLTVLEIGDDPEAWRNAGFSVAGGRMVLDGVEFRFLDSDDSDDSDGQDDARRGISGWHLQDISEPGADLDGLVDVPGPNGRSGTSAVHPNGITVIDHLVVATPNLERTINAFKAAGLDDRRTRTFVAGGTERQQTFFWAGSTIIELIGEVGECGDGPATFWGLALVSDDIDATAAFSGDRISTPKEAIQPGRRIATLQTRELGISVPLAVLTPHKVVENGW